jgi:hypothetical protein
MADNKVAVDIEDIKSEDIIDAFLTEKGEVFRTARGRRAILIGTAALLRLKTRLGLYVEDGHDGNKVFTA